MNNENFDIANINFLEEISLTNLNMIYIQNYLQERNFNKKEISDIFKIINKLKDDTEIKEYKVVLFYDYIKNFLLLKNFEKGQISKLFEMFIDIINNNIIIDDIFLNKINPYDFNNTFKILKEKILSLKNNNTNIIEELFNKKQLSIDDLDDRYYKSNFLYDNIPRQGWVLYVPTDSLEVYDTFSIYVVPELIKNNVPFKILKSMFSENKISENITENDKNLQSSFIKNIFKKENKKNKESKSEIKIQSEYISNEINKIIIIYMNIDFNISPESKIFSDRCSYFLNDFSYQINKTSDIQITNVFFAKWKSYFENDIFINIEGKIDNSNLSNARPSSVLIKSNEILNYHQRILEKNTDNQKNIINYFNEYFLGFENNNEKIMPFTYFVIKKDEIAKIKNLKNYKNNSLRFSTFSLINPCDADKDKSFLLVYHEELNDIVQDFLDNNIWFQHYLGQTTVVDNFKILYTNDSLTKEHNTKSINNSLQSNVISENDKKINEIINKYNKEIEIRDNEIKDLKERNKFIIETKRIMHENLNSLANKYNIPDKELETIEKGKKNDTNTNSNNTANINNFKNNDNKKNTNTSNSKKIPNNKKTSKKTYTYTANDINEDDNLL